MQKPVTSLHRLLYYKDRDHFIFDTGLLTIAYAIV